MGKKFEMTFIGTGYVGLVTGACFAKIGLAKDDLDIIVNCNDIDEEKINLLKQGTSPFYEKDFDIILKEVVDKKLLIPSIDLDESVETSDVIFICVGTPSKPSGEVDLTFIKNAAKNLGKSLKKVNSYKIVCVKSTVVPETTRTLFGKILEEHSEKVIGQDFGLMFIPEFLREGNAVFDTMNPDRIIIGTMNDKDRDFMKDLFQSLYDDIPVLVMSLESAEMVKYVSNCFLATKISFSNEIASIAEQVINVDIDEVMKGVGLDSRISPSFFNSGAGFGGSCFPKDVSAFVSFAKQRNYDSKILQSVLDKNYEQALHVVDLARSLIKSFKGKIVSILGLSFKPGTSDMREAPSIKIINKILEEGPKSIIAYDPVATEEAKHVIGEKITYAKTIDECLKGSNICIIVTEWEEFSQLTPEQLKNLMIDKNIVDGRRILDSKSFSKDFNLKVIGRGILS